MPTNRQRGQHYEQIAAQYLTQHGLQIIAQNFFCKGGEIDLVALEQQTLVFIEVKYRQTNQHGEASEFINTKKLQRLYRCAQVFLLKHRQFQQAAMRFDSLCITGQPDKIEWLKNIYNGW
ncbi:YraN family protein [Thiomicrospira microaerophila]|uniref:YraN family protein n=1 Tax=Thiomicrospira microaerophila TaxID=406020 RepID=UPI0005CAFE88|nr:YraN family protein [Thiomicrospira microaerophila]